MIMVFLSGKYSLAGIHANCKRALCMHSFLFGVRIRYVNHRRHVASLVIIPNKVCYCTLFAGTESIKSEGHHVQPVPPRSISAAPFISAGSEPVKTETDSSTKLTSHGSSSSSSSSSKKDQHPERSPQVSSHGFMRRRSRGLSLSMAANTATVGSIPKVRYSRRSTLPSL